MEVGVGRGAGRGRDGRVSPRRRRSQRPALSGLELELISSPS